MALDSSDDCDSAVVSKKKSLFDELWHVFIYSLYILSLSVVKLGNIG